MIEQAANKAVENYVKRQSDINISKIDRRYQNTELLLKNYYRLKKHIEESVDKESEDYAELFDVKLDEKDKIFLTSIFRTRRRTKVMMNHVDKCLENYKKICNSNNKEAEMRKYKIIELLYLAQDKAIHELSALIFGIESLGIY